MRKLILFLYCALLIIPYSVQGSKYNWPVVIHADIEVSGVYPGTSYPSYSGTIYWRSITLDNDWGDQLPMAMVAPGVGFIYRNIDNRFLPLDLGPLTYCKPAETNKTCLDEFEAIYGTSGSFHLDSAALSSNLCLALSMSSRVQSEGTGTTLNVPTGLVGSCFKIVDPDEHCSVTSDNIIFDYGVIHTKEIDDARAEAKVYVECNSDNTKFSLRTGAPNDELTLSNGMKASVNLNGSPVSPQVITSVAGTQVITLDSRLKGTPVSTGPFTGTGILYMAYE